MPALKLMGLTQTQALLFLSSKPIHHNALSYLQAQWPNSRKPLEVIPLLSVMPSITPTSLLCPSSYFFFPNNRQLGWHTSKINAYFELTRLRVPATYWLSFSQQCNTCLSARQLKQLPTARGSSISQPYIQIYIFF